MKKYIFLSIALLAAAGYFFYTNMPAKPKISPVDDRIKAVTFENCKINVVTRDDNKYVAGSLEKSGSVGQDCIVSPKYAISDSGKYFVFEDVSGGVDLWVRIYSIQTKKINTLAVWGTSSLLDITFTDIDKLAVLSGYPDIPEEQWLKIYDIPGMYSLYPTNVDEYGYLSDTNFKKELALKPMVGDYFEIKQVGNKLVIYGGSKQSPVVRNEFTLE